MLTRKLASSVVGPAPLRARSRVFLTTGSAARIFGPATSPLAPSDFSETVEAAENGVSARVAWVSDGAALASDSATGVPASEKYSKLPIVCRSSRRKAGSLRSEASRAAPSSALACAAAPALEKKPATLRALARERPEDLLGVGGELRQPVALGPEDAEEAIGVAQHRVGALDDLLDVLAAPGEPGAEFVEDQPEALHVGQLVDVVDQVRVDAGAVVLDRQQVLAGARLPVGDLLQRRRRLGARRARQGGTAVDELLADQRLGADQAAGVAAEVLEARIDDLHRDHGLARDRLRLAVLVAVDLTRHRHADRFDFADGRAGDPHFLALDHEAAAVEDRADDVAVAAVAAAGEQRDGHDDHGDQPGCE